jgi:hypothetical protein
MSTTECSVFGDYGFEKKKLEEAHEKQNLELRTGNNWKNYNRAKGRNNVCCKQ